MEKNWDEDGTCHNEVRLTFRLRDNDPCKSMKTGLLDGSAPTKGFRVSMHHNGQDDTTRAMSYLRFICAQKNDIMVLPSMGRNYDLSKKPINPISCENEVRA